VAESVFEEGFGCFAAPDDAAEAASVKVSGEEFYEEVGGGGCEFTVWFISQWEIFILGSPDKLPRTQDTCISSGNDSDEWKKCYGCQLISHDWNGAALWLDIITYLMSMDNSMFYELTVSMPLPSDFKKPHTQEQEPNPLAVFG
jgi:hypothetical protein